MSIVARYFLEDLESKEEPLPHHKAGLMYTATGYGRKIPTVHMVKLPGSPRWRRVYCCVFSNAGTCYVTQGKDWVVIA
jgi:hypothetical protein